MTETAAGPFQLRQRIQILRTARKLVKSGDIKAGMSEDDIKDAIIVAMTEDDPTMLAAGFDWQSFLDLLIKMLPLILAIFGL
jgi:hypothetical protein